MKKILALLLVISFCADLLSQAPQKMNYQAVVRNSAGQPLPRGTMVAIRFSIHDQTPTGTVVFTENQTDTVNEFGLVNMHVGAVNNLGVINWGNGAKYLQVELDPSGGTNFTTMG